MPVHHARPKYLETMSPYDASSKYSETLSHYLVLVLSIGKPYLFTMVVPSIRNHVSLPC